MSIPPRTACLSRRCCRGNTMRRDPALTWKYLGQIESACRGARFNRAHAVVAEMENHFERVWTLTQNVDGFHRAAGSRNVIDIHGDLHRLMCTACSFRETVEDFRHLELPPLCPRCKTMLRPDVVLFGEMLSLEKVQAAEGRAGRRFRLRLHGRHLQPLPVYLGAGRGSPPAGAAHRGDQPGAPATCPTWWT